MNCERDFFKIGKTIRESKKSLKIREHKQMTALEIKKEINLVIDGIANNTVLTREELEDLVICILRSESYYALMAIEPLLIKLGKQQNKVSLNNLNYLCTQLEYCLDDYKTQIAIYKDDTISAFMKYLRKED